MYSFRHGQKKEDQGGAVWPNGKTESQEKHQTWNPFAMPSAMDVMGRRPGDAVKKEKSNERIFHFGLKIATLGEKRKNISPWGLDWKEHLMIEKSSFVASTLTSRLI